MPPLTDAALSLHQDLCARQQSAIADSHAASVVRQERLYQHFSQLGVIQGHNHLAVGEDTAAGAPPQQRQNGTNTHNGINANRSGSLRADEHNDSTTNSLSLFMPPHRPQGSYHFSADTPLERFLALGACHDPTFISRPALAQMGCYGRMESAEARQRQAQASAARVVEEAEARRGRSPDSMKYL